MDAQSYCPWPLAILCFVGFLVMGFYAQWLIRDHYKDSKERLNEIYQLKRRLIAAGALIQRRHFPKYVDPDRLIDMELLAMDRYEKERAQ